MAFITGLSKQIKAGRASLSVVGLGYVGMPLAVAFAEHISVIGFDTNQKKIEQYQSGVDPTSEVGDDVIVKTAVRFTAEETELQKAKFHIIAVPTPINPDKTPDLAPVISASQIVGRNLSPGSIVVYESTVYPGVTRDICMPILEQESGLTCGKDFSVGYSPERINPGDQIHRLENIVKIVSGLDTETREEMVQVYSLVIGAEIHQASSIEVAEAAKVAENSQRDINIAFINELAMAFDKMGIDTNEVVNAMNTKWNALGFRPGLVGGHCIGVDPYYFIYEAEKLGYHSQIIAAGRRINDGMAQFVADATIRQMVLAGLAPVRAKVIVMGLTFKENCSDLRNSKIADMVSALKKDGICPLVIDPWADPAEAKQEYGIALSTMEDARDADCIVFAVAHGEFKELTGDSVKNMFRRHSACAPVLIDVKGIFKQKPFDCRYWRL
ncbi:MAG: nucleotide sugar dehydrogenase [Oscillospiraceae bacterium]